MRGALVERDDALAEAKKPVCTADEISGYVWAKPTGSTANKAEPEVPLKVDDHGSDTLRYVVAELDLVGSSSVLSPALRGQTDRRGASRAASRYGRVIGGGTTRTR
ncbi:hypothetical protein [Streptomyces sp. NPDC001020]